MSSHRTGMVFLPADAGHAVDLLARADRAAVGTAWLEMNAIGLDPVVLLAAAARQTRRIGLGTAILPAFSRHPVALATQALALEGLAPGRVRLGIGTGNARRMAEAYHHPTDRPLTRLREYLRIVRTLLHEGTVHVAGEFYSADAEIGEPPGTPVLLSALGARAFAAAGELADGALSWLCPVGYLLDVALPAMERGAALAGRARPPLIAHVTVALGDSDDVREQVRRDVSRYVRVPVFARMLTEAGHRVADGEVTDDLLDDLAVIGAEDTVAARLAAILDRGVDEVMVSLAPETHDPDREAALLRVLEAVDA